MNPAPLPTRRGNLPAPRPPIQAAKQPSELPGKQTPAQVADDYMKHGPPPLTPDKGRIAGSFLPSAEEVGTNDGGLMSEPSADGISTAEGDSVQHLQHEPPPAVTRVTYVNPEVDPEPKVGRASSFFSDAMINHFERFWPYYLAFLIFVIVVSLMVCYRKQLHATWKSMMGKKEQSLTQSPKEQDPEVPQDPPMGLDIV